MSKEFITAPFTACTKVQWKGNTDRTTDIENTEEILNQYIRLIVKKVILT